ncbi:MAG TPA: sialidase family protein, partial [Pirellulaceae bacterium]|nr:sialidase family protein [Pirellulaceae bacterium]
MWHRVVLALLFVLACRVAVSAAEPTKIDVFTADTDGYTVCRIPGLVVTAKGSLLAYCEARRTNSDWGEIDLLLRRSTDGGQTWSKPQKVGKLPRHIKRNVVAAEKKIGASDKFTMNNPVAIADRDGSVHLLYCIEYARCFYVHSTDDGQSFSEPIEITATFEKFQPNYAWKVLATGPGHGVQLKKGRLLVPVWLSPGTGGNAHHPSAVATIFSDDHGQTWQHGAIVARNSEKFRDPSETAAVELSDGRVLLNMRNESLANRRLIAISSDGASNWSEPKFDDALLEPICMASLARVNDKQIVFSNPANLLSKGKEGQPGRGRDRINLTVRLSSDDGQTWPLSRVLEP